MGGGKNTDLIYVYLAWRMNHLAFEQSCLLEM
jgi:hypothetical protein